MNMFKPRFAFDDLKENMLVKTTRDRLFEIYTTNEGFGVLLLPTEHANKNRKVTQKALILLSEVEVHEYYKAWRCFCGGKICIFSISSYELNFLVKAYDST